MVSRIRTTRSGAGRLFLVATPTIPHMIPHHPPGGAAPPKATRNRAARMRLRKSVFSTMRSEEHTSELQSLMRTSYAVFCLKKTKTTHRKKHPLATLHLQSKQKTT